jgi:hypothetical protein
MSVHCSRGEVRSALEIACILLGELESVPDGVTGAKTNPLRNRSVLLLGSGELDLRPESLVALWMKLSVLQFPIVY